MTNGFLFYATLVLLPIFLISILLLSPVSSFASSNDTNTNNQNNQVTKIEKTQSNNQTPSNVQNSKTSNIQPNSNENSTNTTIQPNILTGGGYLSCHSVTYGAECGAGLTNLDAMSYYSVTVHVYEVLSNGSTGAEINSAYKAGYVNGLKSIYPYFNAIALPAGTYKAKLTGYVLTYNSDLPEGVGSIWSTKFTVN